MGPTTTDRLPPNRPPQDLEQEGWIVPGEIGTVGLDTLVQIALNG